MSCKDIISDEDILSIYKGVVPVDTHTLVSECKNSSTKSYELELKTENAIDISLRPVQRIYHGSRALRAFHGIGKVAEHKLFVLSESYRNKGIAKSLSRKEAAVYQRNGFNEVHLDAAWDGVVVWKKLGYEYVGKKDPAKIYNLWKNYLAQEFSELDIEERLKTIKKYATITDVPKKFLIPAEKQSFGMWIEKKRKIFIVKMYKRVL